jgi:hypothetical protein
MNNIHTHIYIYISIYLPDIPRARCKISIVHVCSFKTYTQRYRYIYVYDVSPWHSKGCQLHINITYTHTRRYTQTYRNKCVYIYINICTQLLYISLAFQGIHTTYEYIIYIHTYIYISLAFQGIHTTYKCVTYTETQIYIYYYVSPWHSEGYIPTQVYPMFPAASSVS